MSTLLFIAPLSRSVYFLLSWIAWGSLIRWTFHLIRMANRWSIQLFSNQLELFEDGNLWFRDCLLRALSLELDGPNCRGAVGILGPQVPSGSLADLKDTSLELDHFRWWWGKMVEEPGMRALRLLIFLDVILKISIDRLDHSIWLGLIKLDQSCGLIKSLDLRTMNNEQAWSWLFISNEKVARKWNALLTREILRKSPPLSHISGTCVTMSPSNFNKLRCNFHEKHINYDKLRRFELNHKNNRTIELTECFQLWLR